MRDRIGSANAAVLPVPVCAWPTTSCPGEHLRDGRRLDRRRRLVADVIERFDDRFVEREIAEIRDGRVRAIGVQGSLESGVRSAWAGAGAAF